MKDIQGHQKVLLLSLSCMFHAILLLLMELWSMVPSSSRRIEPNSPTKYIYWQGGIGRL